MTDWACCSEETPVIVPVGKLRYRKEMQCRASGSKAQAGTGAHWPPDAPHPGGCRVQQGQLVLLRELIPRQVDKKPGVPEEERGVWNSLRGGKDKCLFSLYIP